MEKNDYVTIGGRLKKVQNVGHCGIVKDVQSGTDSEEKLISCHIIITKEILEACGFKHDSGYFYKLNLIDSQSGRDYTIIANLEPLVKEYSIIEWTCIHDTIREKKQIIILSELQDWIRNKTGLELDIDEHRLVEIVNK